MFKESPRFKRLGLSLLLVPLPSRTETKGTRREPGNGPETASRQSIKPPVLL